MPLLLSSPTCLVSWAFWLIAYCSWASSACSLATCLRKRPTCDLALNVSEKKLATSRNGESTVLAPSSTGENTSTIQRWSVCNGLEGDSPKYAVRRIRETATRAATTARRRLTCFLCTGSVSPNCCLGELPAPALES